MPMPLESIEVETAPKPDAAVIWLHGLGADGHDFEPIVPQIQLQLPVPVRFIFPHAPHKSVTINGGNVMRAWYDITSPNLSRGEDVEGIHESAQFLNALIGREV